MWILLSSSYFYPFDTVTDASWATATSGRCVKRIVMEACYTTLKSSLVSSSTILCRSSSFALGKLLTSASLPAGRQGASSLIRVYQLTSAKKGCSLRSLIPFIAPRRFLGSLYKSCSRKSLASALISCSASPTGGHTISLCRMFLKIYSGESSLKGRFPVKNS